MATKIEREAGASGRPLALFRLLVARITGELSRDWLARTVESAP